MGRREELDGFRAFLKAQRQRVQKSWAARRAYVTRVRNEGIADGWMDEAPVSVAWGRGSKKPGLDYYDRRGW